MAQDQKRKQEIKGQRRYNAHIDSGNRLSVISKKCLPGLRRWVPNSHHVFRDRRLSDLKAKHQEFAMDPGRAPLRVFLAHSLNEITQPTIDLRAPCPISGFPAPESFEARAMPPKDGLGLTHWAHAEQPRPEPGHQYQQPPVTAAQPKTRRGPPQSDVELMTEKQILDFKPQPRLEHVGDEHSERAQDRKHYSK